MRAAWLAALLLVLPACAADPSDAAEGAASIQLRLGYFPNLTHATAIVGIEQGIFADALPDGVELAPQVFNAGPDVVEAIFSGALDAAYIGPNPAINAFTRSEGQAIRIVSGATSGGAALVVRAGIDGADELHGATLATPQLGNTQDVALRAWLAEQGLVTDLEGGGDVAIMPQPNGQALEAFASGAIDGAWVPEPWATRMVTEAGAHVLVDERDLWPDGRFVTTHLIVATAFLEAHPDAVAGLVAGQVAATAFIHDQPDAARDIVGTALETITGSTLPEGVLAEAWTNLEFTNDPIAASLTVSANRALELGLLASADLTGIYELAPLNAALLAAGEPPIAEP